MAEAEPQDSLEVFAPAYHRVLTIPRTSVVHLPPSSKGSRLMVCANFDNALACVMGARCRFVHTTHDWRAEGNANENNRERLGEKQIVRASSVHVNYAWRAVDDVVYERYRPGTLLRVASPNSRRVSGTITSDMALRTNALRSFRRPLCLCSHYTQNQICKRGATCNFVHPVHVDPDARDHQFAPRRGRSTRPSDTAAGDVTHLDHDPWAALLPHPRIEITYDEVRSQLPSPATCIGNEDLPSTFEAVAPTGHLTVPRIRPGSPIAVQQSDFSQFASSPSTLSVSDLAPAEAAPPSPQPVCTRPRTLSVSSLVSVGPRHGRTGSHGSRMTPDSPATVGPPDLVISCDGSFATAATPQPHSHHANGHQTETVTPTNSAASPVVSTRVSPLALAMAPASSFAGSTSPLAAPKSPRFRWDPYSANGTPTRVAATWSIPEGCDSRR